MSVDGSGKRHMGWAFGCVQKLAHQLHHFFLVHFSILFVRGADLNHLDKRPS